MYTKTIVLGRAGRQPEMRYTPSGKAVTNVSVAADIGYGDNKKTIWYRVSFWEKLAEVVNQYVGKGDKLYIEGELQPDDNGGPRVYQAKNGEHRASFELTGRMVKFLSPRSENQSSGQPAEDDIPF